MNGWDDIVAQFVAAEDKPDKMKVFTQQVLGEAYEEKGDAPPVDLLIGRREAFDFARIPKGALFLTARRTSRPTGSSGISMPGAAISKAG